MTTNFTAIEQTRPTQFYTHIYYPTNDEPIESACPSISLQSTQQFFFDFFTLFKAAILPIHAKFLQVLINLVAMNETEGAETFDMARKHSENVKFEKRIVCNWCCSTSCSPRVPQFGLFHQQTISIKSSF